MISIKSTKGFTIIELLVAFGVLATLMGIAAVNLLGSSHRAFEQNSASTLISDIKSQQIKAMNGDTQNSGINDRYGVYFQSDRYVLFKGSSYSPANTSNLIITIPQSVSFSNILFPSSQLVFASGSGEIVGFSSGLSSVTIRSADGSQKTVTLNRFGVVTSN